MIIGGINARISQKARPSSHLNVAGVVVVDNYNGGKQLTSGSCSHSLLIIPLLAMMAILMVDPIILTVTLIR